MTDEITEQKVEEGGQDGNPEVEARARDMGWQPKENWKGNPDNWVDAGEFVRRGETFVPFLQHQRKKLMGDLEQERAARQNLEKQLQETRESVGELRKMSEEMAADRNERRKAELGAELRAAREAGDDVKVAELQNELSDVVRKPEPPARKPEPIPPAPPEIQPWVKQFVDGNQEFFGDSYKIALFNAAMIRRRQEGDKRTGPTEGAALLQEVRDEVDKIFGGNPARRAVDKTEGSRPAGNGGSRSSGRGYGDMDADAQRKCDAQEARFVGPTKLFKDQASWRKHFAGEYFGPSAVAAERGANR